MIFRRILFHILAMTIAYGSVLIIPMLFDYAFDTNVEIFVIVWLNTGLFVMRLKNMPFPQPDNNRVDVRGGWRALWWAAFWPSYLLRR